MLDAPHQLSPYLACKTTRSAAKQSGRKHSINSPQCIPSMMGTPATIENSQNRNGSEIQHSFGDINFGDASNSSIDHLRGPFTSLLSIGKNRTEIGQDNWGHALNIADRNTIQTTRGLVVLFLNNRPEFMGPTRGQIKPVLWQSIPSKLNDCIPPFQGNINVAKPSLLPSGNEGFMHFRNCPRALGLGDRHARRQGINCLKPNAVMIGKNDLQLLSPRKNGKVQVPGDGIFQRNAAFTRVDCKNLGVQARGEQISTYQARGFQVLKNQTRVSSSVEPSILF